MEEVVKRHIDLGFVDYYDRGIFFYFVLDYSHGRKINPLLYSIIFLAS